MTSLDTLLRVFERALDSIEIADPRGRYVYVNAGFELLTGYAREEALGKTPRELLRSDVHPTHFYDSIWDTIAAGKSTIATMVSRRKDGENVTHELSITPHFDDDGAIEWYVGTRRDLTERVAREDSLRRTAELYRDMFTNNPAIKLLLDPKSGRIVDANPAAVQFYGWDRDALLRMRIHEIQTTDDPGVEAALARVMSDARSRYLFEHRVASGARRRVEVSSSALHVGRTARVLSIIQDVTERERLDEALRRSQRMEAVGRLAGGIAHDFNNLLQVVFTSTALLELDGLSADSIRQSVARIDEAASRAADLTRQLLLFSRGDTSRVELVDLHAVVATASRLIRATLEPEVTLAVEATFPARLPVRIVRASFEQVVLELAARARQSMPSGGTIRLRVDRLVLAENEVPTLAPGAYAALEIEDDGETMSEDLRAHAFEPFYLAVGERQGTGLGLAMLYGIVQRAGGTVVLESRVPSGSVFRVILPLGAEARSPETAAKRGDDRPFDGRGLTVLLVDDERAICDVVSLILSHHGIDVLSATDADSALRLARERAETIDVLLTDIVMPECRGPELAKRVAEICPRAEVVFMSGYVGDAWERGAPESARLLAKPFSPKSLVDAIRAAVGDAAP